MQKKTKSKYTQSVMQFFEDRDLPDHLKRISKEFYDLATKMDIVLPDNPEKTLALRSLLTAKECSFRAVLFREG